MSNKEHTIYIPDALRELDELYDTPTFGNYEAQWRLVAKEIERDYPGFSLAYAQVFTTGIRRVTRGEYRHVLVPPTMCDPEFSF
jgi:hypothetical protein